MDSTAHFLVSPRLANLLGETYRSSEAALKELVDNSWDADATEVWVTLPKPMTSEPIVVRDNGGSMSEQQLRSEYLFIARDKRTSQGERTPKFKRKTKGRKGIGKFAGLTVASKMELLAVSNAGSCKLFIDKLQLSTTENDLEEIPLKFESMPENIADIGTTITLSELEQSLNFPRPEYLKQLLFREYGREQNFEIFIDNQKVGFRDLSGNKFDEKCDLSESVAKLSFTITDEKSKPKTSGISLRVDGKVVGKSSFFGLENDPEIPLKLLKSVVGEIEIPDIEGLVTADWGGVNESSKAYVELVDFVQKRIKEKLSITHKKQILAQKARLKRKIDARLAKLPENKRHYAEKAIHRIMAKFFDESDERIGVIVDVALDAMELDGYWAVLEKISTASNGTVLDFADALAEFGLLELANLGGQTRNRDVFLTHLKHLSDDPKTLEETMHKALEKNLWVFGLKRTLISSNITLKSMVKDFLDKKYKGKSADKRPDLFLGEAVDGNYLLIEFKRPNKVIGRAEISQAEDYRDELRAHLSAGAKIDVIVVGKKPDPKILQENLAQGIEIESYNSCISRARTEIEWLLDQLTRQ